jgi:hypothetical protein
MSHRRRVERKLDQIITLLTALAVKEGQMAKTLDDVQADVTAQTTVVSSVVTLLQGLKAQLDVAIASGNPAKVQAVADALEANTTALANAVAANTPAQP